MVPGATWARSGGVQRSERTRRAHPPTKHRMGLRAHTFVRPALRQQEPFPHHLLIMVAQRGVKGGGAARRSLARLLRPAAQRVLATRRRLSALEQSPARVLAAGAS